MDPVTQGLLGAAATQAVLGKTLGRRAWLYGAVGGMAADLDVLIASSEDPLLALRFHRHFTHSLSFIPIGGALSALPFLVTPRQRQRWRPTIAATTVGYATHAILDAFTSYGTMLLWPWTDMRVAWSFIAIIDPIYTLVLAIGVIGAARRLDARWARLGLLVSSLYMAFCGVQRGRALEAARDAAHARGDAIARLDAFPMIPANVVWRTAYETEDGELVFGEARVPWFGPVRTRPGARSSRVHLLDLPDAVQRDDATRRAFETWEWFSAGWVTNTGDDPHVVGDLRYSLTIAGADPLWSMRLQPGEQPPVVRVDASRRADPGKYARRLWRNLLYGEHDAP